MSDKDVQQKLDRILHKLEVLEDQIAEVRVIASGEHDTPTYATDDELFQDAVVVVRNAGKASSALLQRRLRIGYERTVRLLDMLEDHGIIGPPDGSKPREVYGDWPRSVGSPAMSGNGDDPLFEDAVAIVRKAGKAEASLLQRKLRIGYARAARLLDILEERNIIGPPDGIKPRKIL